MTLALPAALALLAGACLAAAASAGAAYLFAYGTALQARVEDRDAWKFMAAIMGFAALSMTLAASAGWVMRGVWG